jgi:hypothetical protein
MPGVMSGLAQPARQRRRQLGVNEETNAAASGFSQHQHRMIGSLRRVFQTGPDILGLQARKVREDFTLRHAGGQQVEHVACRNRWQLPMLPMPERST